MAKAISSESIDKLLKIMTTLRSPQGCPWDIKQTPETLRPYILEEAYEVIEAIDRQSEEDIKDELGDLLLQIVFIAQIFKEQSSFDFTDVVNGINNKMIRRHPHVFGGADATEHAKRWEEIKQKEREEKGQGTKLTERIPKNLPALKKASKVAKKIKSSGTSSSQVLKLQHELTNMSKLVENPNTAQDRLRESLSEIFFDTVKLANSLDIDSEDLLRQKTMQVMLDSDK